MSKLKQVYQGPQGVVTCYKDFRTVRMESRLNMRARGRRQVEARVRRRAS